MKLLLLLAAAVFAVTVIVLLKARAHEAQAEAAFPPEGEFIDVDGIRGAASPPAAFFLLCSGSG